MIGGYYTAVSAMAAMMAEQQIIANNLANLNTIGYKQDIPQENEFERILFNALVPRSALGKMSEATGPVGRIGTGVELLPTDLDLTTGPLVPTHRPLDLALPNSGFFRVLDSTGPPIYTRAGTFLRDSNGTLVTPQGEILTDIDGDPITLGPGAVVTRADGSIYLNDQLVSSIAIMDLSDGEAWRKVGLLHFMPHNPEAEPEQLASPGLLRGFLEQSNVDPDSQVVEMMSVLHIYKAAQATLSMTDESISQAVHEAGRVR